MTLLFRFFLTDVQEFAYGLIHKDDMGLHLSALRRQLVDLSIHDFLLLLDEFQRFVLVQLDKEMLANFHHEAVGVQGLCLQVEFFAHVDTGLELFQLLLSDSLDGVSQLKVLAKLLINHIPCLIVLFELRPELFLGEILVSLNLLSGLSLGDHGQIFSAGRL